MRSHTERESVQLVFLFISAETVPHIMTTATKRAKEYKSMCHFYVVFFPPKCYSVMDRKLQRSQLSCRLCSLVCLCFCLGSVFFCMHPRLIYFIYTLHKIQVQCITILYRNAFLILKAVMAVR